jgi:aminoglycoside phosphotransferase (APT) family kinase protein
VATWEPEHVVDEPLARRLLEQFPELSTDGLRLLSYGWDYTIWVVEERYAFRFPRREVVLPGMGRELAFLPKLAPLLPVPVPVARFVGEPGGDYPWPFFGSALLPGREPAEAGLDDAGRLALALEVASFLRVLHGVELQEPLPLDVNRRADMPHRVTLVREQLADLAGGAPPEAEPVLAEAERLPPSEHVAVVHGDLHVRQVLAEGARLTGVIDWVDVCRSDPAIDLSLLWSFLPPPARPAFLEAYGPLDEAQLLRARVVALSLCAALAGHAHAEGLDHLEREALAGLGRALDGDISV